MYYFVSCQSIASLRTHAVNSHKAKSCDILFFTECVHCHILYGGRLSHHPGVWKVYQSRTTNHHYRLVTMYENLL